MNRINLMIQALKALEPLANIPLEDMTQRWCFRLPHLNN